MFICSNAGVPAVTFSTPSPLILYVTNRRERDHEWHLVGWIMKKTFYCTSIIKAAKFPCYTMALDLTKEWLVLSDSILNPCRVIWLLIHSVLKGIHGLLVPSWDFRVKSLLEGKKPWIKIPTWEREFSVSLDKTCSFFFLFWSFFKLEVPLESQVLNEI